MTTSIREALESAVSAEEAKQSSIAAAPEPVEAAPVEQVQPAEHEVPIGETAEQKTERLRDEKGRFAEGKGDEKSLREKMIAEGKIKPAAKPEAVEAQPAVPEQPVVPRPARPQSWKKDYEQDWEKLDPKIAAYINQREDEYFKGVSTYKQEWENAKPLLDSIAPFMPLLQQHGIKPDHWIANMGNAHRTLAMGSGQEKLNAFARLAQDYGVPLQALYDPAVAQQFVQQTMMQPRMQPQQQPQAVDVEKIVEAKLSAARTQDAITQFAADTAYPHFERLKEDMALILDAGKAHDLKGAYAIAERMHDDLWQARQQATTAASDAARLEAQRKAVAAAKGSAVSVRSATPASNGAAPPNSIREALTSAYDAHVGGRV